jgi:hypothetical protein
VQLGESEIGNEVATRLATYFANTGANAALLQVRRLAGAA